MAHYAFINDKNIVTEVITGKNETDTTFTIECWIYPTATPTGSVPAVMGSMSPSASNNDISFGIGSSKLVHLYWYDGAVKRCTENTTVPLGTWTHLAASVSSNSITLYVNGVSQTLTGTTTLTNRNIATGTFTFGQNYGSAYYYTGYISTARVVNGVAVYTGTFTPPTLAPLTTAGSTSAASYPSTTNVNTSFAASSTNILTNYTNAGIYDAAVQNNGVTAGSAQASTTQFKWSPTSMKFNGTTDYLTSVRGDGYNLGTVYTVEAWVYPSSVSGNQGIINLSTGATVNVGFNFYLVGSTVTVNNGSLGGTGPSGGTLATGQWYYIAIVCNGTNTVLYINGTLTNTYVGVTGFFGTWTNATIGNIADKSMYFNGYIQDLRLTKGIARTVTTVPTAAFPTQ